MYIKMHWIVFQCPTMALFIGPISGCWRGYGNCIDQLLRKQSDQHSHSFELVFCVKTKSSEGVCVCNVYAVCVCGYTIHTQVNINVVFILWAMKTHWVSLLVLLLWWWWIFHLPNIKYNNSVKENKRSIHLNISIHIQQISVHTHIQRSRHISWSYDDKSVNLMFYFSLVSDFGAISERH